MKKKLLIASLAICSLASINSWAQKGALTPEMLKEIRGSYKNSPTDKALRNAVINTGMKDLVKNTDKSYDIEDHFSNEVKGKGITDQHNSGRCWLFTGLNVLRSHMITQNNMGQFFFSHNYSFFWDQLEKANLFLQGIIDTRDKAINDKMVEWLFKNPIGDGGQFTGVSENLMKYGVVPAEIMPETTSSNSTAVMSSILAKVLRQGGIRIREHAAKGTSMQKLEAEKVSVLKDVYRILVMNLGVPPREFSWTLKDANGKAISTETYTPQSFYQKFVGRDLRNNYVMLMNDPSRDYYKLYEIDYDRHSYDGKNWTYVNLPMEDIKGMAIASIKDSTMMYYSCDVGKELDRKKGYLDLDNFDYQSLLGIKLDMNKKERIQTYDSGSSHAMTLMAVDLDANGKAIKWKVENSWGATNGFKGHLIMTDRWFDAYTFRLVVDKKYITDKVKEVMGTKPIRLPAWDPMFMPEN